MKNIIDFDKPGRGHYQQTHGQEELYKKIYKMYEEDGNTQAYIASTLNIPASTISRIIQHRKKVSKQDITILDDHYERNEDDLLSNILSQMYQIKWEDRQLRDVWEIITRLRKLGASL